MKYFSQIFAVLFSAFLFQSSSVIADELVNGYLTASGSVVTNSYGECWRTSYQDTSEKLEACGYMQAVPAVTENVTQIEVVKTPSAASVTVKKMEKITIGANMLFEFDSAELTDNAKAVIHERIDRFKGKGRLTSNMEVHGHTCNMGPESYNQVLSEKRAQAVANYIAEYAPNVDVADINVVGKGESMPVASNDTKAGRMQNRRVEIFAEAEIKK